MPLAGARSVLLASCRRLHLHLAVQRLRARRRRWLPGAFDERQLQQRRALHLEPQSRHPRPSDRFDRQVLIWLHFTRAMPATTSAVPASVVPGESEAPAPTRGRLLAPAAPMGIWAERLFGPLRVQPRSSWRGPRDDRTSAGSGPLRSLTEACRERRLYGPRISAGCDKVISTSLRRNYCAIRSRAETPNWAIRQPFQPR
jgi:hypothetical protein